MLKNYRLDRLWSGSAGDMDVTWSSSQSLDTIAVGGISGNVSSNLGSLVRATGGWGAPSGEMALLALDEPVSRSSITLTFSDFNAAWVYAGLRFRSEKGIRDDYSYEIIPGPGNRRTRVVTLAWPVLRQQETANLRELCLHHGMETPLVLIPRSEPTYTWNTEAMLCRIYQNPSFQPWFEAGSNKRNKASITFSEVLA